MTETYRGEAMLLRWSESADSGMTVTLKLDDGPDGYKTHPCKGLPVGKAHGQRFAMMLVPVSETEETPSPRAAEPKRWDDLKPSQQMGIACNDPAFQRWLDARFKADGPEIGTADEAAELLRHIFGIDSRRDADLYESVAVEWRKMYAAFLADTRSPEQR